MASASAAAPARAQPTSGRWGVVSPWLQRIGRWFAILLLAVIFGFPLYWTVTMSFKPLDEWNPPGKVYWFPQNPTVSNYTDILGIQGPTSGFFSDRSRSALPYIKNSLIAAQQPGAPAPANPRPLWVAS